MKIFLISPILLATMMSLSTVRGGEDIDDCYCRKNIYNDCNSWHTIGVLCDEYYRSNTVVHCTCFIPYKDFLNSGITEIGFNCSMPYLGAYLSTILKDFSKVKMLNLSNVNLLSLEKENLKNLPATLSNAVFSHNRLINISSNLFIYNENIRSVDFSFNRISEIETSAFVNATMLETIDISNNLLKNITRNMFSHNENLRVLNVSFNRISEIDARSLYYTTKLEVIDISKNLLKTIPEYLLLFNENIRFVNMSFNQISFISIFQFTKATKLETIDISNNHLKRFGDEHHGFAWIDSLRLTINLSFNQISEIDDKLINQLEVIDLSNNLLTTTPELYSETLRFVNLSNNRIISPSGFGILDNLIGTFFHASNLETYDISNNFLDNIDAVNIEKEFCQTYLDAYSLKSLSLANNNLTKLDCNTQKGLLKLEFLNVNENKFSELNLSCIPNNFKLNISKNEVILKTLTLSANIISLDASESKINRIDAVSDLKKLIHLNVSGCEIQNMNEVLGKLDLSLQTLDASFNYIGKLNYSSFIKLENMEYLSLRSTHLSEIALIAFLNLRKLKTLDISYNDLKVIQFNFKLKSPNHLYDYWYFNWESFYLDGNNLSELDENLSELHFPSLKVLGISKNNFNCDYLLDLQESWKTLQLGNDKSATSYNTNEMNCHHFTEQENKSSN